MVNEAVEVELHGEGSGGDPIRYTVADNVAVSAGSLMITLDPKTIIKSEAGTAGQALAPTFFAGIAASDKEASDGATTLAVFTKGIFDLNYGGGSAISAGQLVTISGANTIVLAEDATTPNLGAIVGKSLEDTAEGTTETIQVLLGALN